MSHIDRRKFIAGTTAAGLSLGAFPGLGILPTANAQRKSSPSEKSPAELITPQTQQKIDRGLAFLQ
ncbi:MAG: twin-arginine translocation signal domain-containing protein, partial [Planctomycetes bacterium]|nr:twin-arginine translocation signal domain-containing protein [Planctomycetota bacterium]